MNESMTKKISAITKRSFLLNAMGIVIFLAGAYLDFQYGTGSLHHKAGKMLGSIAITFAGLSLLYYLLRTLYMQTKQRKIILPLLVDKLLKAGITNFRIVHPLLGFIAFYTALLHGYFMLFDTSRSYVQSIIVSGSFGLFILAVLMILGINMQKNKLFREYHRKAALMFFIMYLCHILLKFDFY
jgi:hypothetical protein